MERRACRAGFLVNPKVSDMTRPISLGFAGLGVMGRPMASHLVLAAFAR
jgi:hypothetical protein